MATNSKGNANYAEANDECEVSTNNQVQIKLIKATSNEDRYNDKNIMRDHINEITSYLSEGRKQAFEELYSKDYEKHIYDQHVRLYIDLDKVVNPRLHVVKKFVKLFVTTFYGELDKMPEDELQISNRYNDDIICDGARIAIKEAINGSTGGVHIYFTTVITHPSSFPNLKRIMTRVKGWGSIRFRERE
ncbi:MAG: hypothetical protein FD167_5222 [bacterium]|nr:MAG: hypothetical protein FD167_5222 [bacterium]